MYQTPRLHQILYVSTLAPDAPLTTVPDIARLSRVNNKRLDITGLMVFDGQRFCQQIEGSIKMVVNLFERISVDPRHGNVCMVHQGNITTRHFRHFNMGYPTIEDSDLLGDLEQLQGAKALAAFSVLLENMDIR